MAFNTNAFWGSSDFDTFRCQTPPTQDLLNNSPSCDNLFDFTESIDPKSSLALLQGPLPSIYEPPDDWLIEFKRLQDVHNRSQAFGVPIAPAPLYHNQSIFVASNISSYQPKINDTSSSEPQQHPHIKFTERDGQGCDPDKTGYATPSTSRQLCSTNPRGPGLYNWNPTPAHENQQTPSDHDIQKVMKGLREIEQNLQADTKRRMSQIEQSRPG